MSQSKVLVNCKFPSRRNAAANNGFTLLELLIALLIGSIVIAVVGGLFLANTNTFRSVDDSARLQENGRFALQTISRITRQAGFIPSDVVQLVKQPDEAYVGGLGGVANARFIAGKDGTGPKGDSDELTVAFLGAPGGQIVDCSGTPQTATPVALGTAISALQPVVNRFYVAQAAAGVPAGFSLWCDSTLGSVAGVGGVTTAYELITGVESFQVLYAVDSVTTTTSATGVVTKTRDFAPDYFTTAKKLESDGNKFNAVLGVQVALVLRGAERSTIDKERTSSVLNLFGSLKDGTALYDGTANSDAGAKYTISSDDKFRTFRVITSTINLRNRAA
jgi:type IV pilus assembly protein PilW